MCYLRFTCHAASVSRESAQGVDSDEDFGVKIAMHTPTQ